MRCAVTFGFFFALFLRGQVCAIELDPDEEEIEDGDSLIDSVDVGSDSSGDSGKGSDIAESSEVSTDLSDESQTPNSTSSTSSTVALYAKLKYSVVRIINVVKPVNIAKPYSTPAIQEDIGSGFMVTFAGVGSDLTIVTNAHVVKGSKKVRVQLPALGRVKYDATVPLVCFHFDLAVVKLTTASYTKLKKVLAKAKGTITKLKLQTGFVQMGQQVAALGFPLGSQWLKLSEGVVAGAEEVGGNMVYQSTAPISPGNSGGPLLAFQKKDGTTTLDTVMGVNFASSGSLIAQNLNYAVPAFRISQVLKLYAKMRTADTGKLDKFGTGTKEHMWLRIAPMGVVSTKTTDAALTASKCKAGISLDKFKIYSLFKWASPAIPARAFLTAVDDTKLDNFGMGQRTQYMGQYVSYKDLLTMRTDLDSKVTVTACDKGTETNHTVYLSWNTTRYKPGIPWVSEPRFDASAMDFEIFAGVTMMQMTLNHIEAALKTEEGVSLSRYLVQENMVKPRIIITSCEPSTTCDGILYSGMVLKSINGKEVYTMKELRKNFQPPKGTMTWELVTDRGVLYVADFKEELKKALKEGKSSMEAFRMTKAVKAAKTAEGLEEEESTALTPTQPTDAPLNTDGLNTPPPTANDVLKSTTDEIVKVIDKLSQAAAKLNKQENAAAGQAPAQGHKEQQALSPEERKLLVKAAHAVEAKTTSTATTKAPEVAAAKATKAVVAKTVLEAPKADAPKVLQAPKTDAAKVPQATKAAAAKIVPEATVVAAVTPAPKATVAKAAAPKAQASATTAAPPAKTPKSLMEIEDDEAGDQEEDDEDERGEDDGRYLAQPSSKEGGWSSMMHAAIESARSLLQEGSDDDAEQVADDEEEEDEQDMAKSHQERLAETSSGFDHNELWAMSNAATSNPVRRSPGGRQSSVRRHMRTEH